MKKITLFLIAIVLIYSIIFSLSNNFELKKQNNLFVNRILNDANYYFYPNKINNNYIYKLVNIINRVKLDKPITIVEKNFYKSSNEIKEFSYIQNEVITKPEVYIYSTHYNEKYIDDKSVVDASLLLQSKLNEMGVNTIVEERSVKEYLEKNNLEFKDSYKATRVFLSDTLEKHNDLKLIIDLHRDATSRATSLSSIDGVDYARIMFVMNENYPNMALASRLNEIVLSKAPITRGIYHKRIDSFNQDLSTNAILIEMGGNYNNFTEVENSIKILAESIKELIDEKS